jgi:hypothetical protein
VSYGGVRVLELAAWGFDEYEYRPQVFDAEETFETRRVPRCGPFHQQDVLLDEETADIHDLLLLQTERTDLLAQLAMPAVPAIRDWPALLALSFGPEKSVECDLVRDVKGGTYLLQSSNPNVSFRVTAETGGQLKAHGGSPFFEVACFLGRWFLRDGYHRAYTLLQAGVFEVPAVIVRARTVEELGAVQPWFFPEEVLFSDAPPLVADFLDDDLVIKYERPKLLKTIRITMEEYFVPALPKGESL